MRVIRSANVALLSFLWSVVALAGEQPPATLDCSVYSRLDDVCKCPAETNYLRSFGLKYCERFRRSTGWTPAGATWRDLTLICLQKELARFAPDYVKTCDCRRLRDQAFASHSYCYTQHRASFCTLPQLDVDKIYGIVDSADLRSTTGLQQGLAIFWNCVTGVFLPESGRKN
jgi:hypothetical protein